MNLDVASLRREFPLLAREISGQRVLYLDCAATTPRCARAIAAVRHFQEHATANVHRGVHALASEASAAFDAARHVVARHLGASADEVVFTSGTTQAINLVAAGFGFEAGDEVVVTAAEHHANLLPWRAHAKVVTLPSREDGTPAWERLEASIGPRTRLLAVHQASNVLGTLAPLAVVGEVARRFAIPWLVDGAQGVAHVATDVHALGCDFYAFSGHKVGGPGGTGALYAKRGWLPRLAPRVHGGGMVAQVAADAHEVRPGPAGFEPGTPNVEGVLGMAAALEFLRDVGMAAIAAHGARLARALLTTLGGLPGVRVLGAADPAVPRIPLVAFTLPPDGLDAETVARTLSDSAGILVASGRHCAHPLHDRVGAGATLRASAWLCHDEGDVARLGAALRGLIA